MKGDKMGSIIRILQIGMTRNIGGLETYLMQQFDYIDKNKLQYDFVNITAEYDIVFKDKILSNGSKIYNICSRHKNPIKHYYQWLELLRNTKNSYDAIVLNSNSLAYIFPLFAAMFCNIPVRILHSHNSNFEGNVNFLRDKLIKFNKKLMNICVTHFLACSKKAGDWMFPEKDYLIVHNAINTTPFIYNEYKRFNKRKELMLEDKFIVGHIGRFTYQKNHEAVINIFNSILKRKNNAFLLLVGDAVDDMKFLDDAKKQVKSLGIENRVLFLGMRKDVPDLMQVMDIFLLPSKFEGLCLVGVEAQAAGLPCFFSDTITNEINLTNLCHFMSLEQSADDWASEILKCSCLVRKNMSKELNDVGYEIKNEIKKIESFYLDVCKNKGNKYE